MPPASSGGTTLAMMLNILEGLGPDAGVRIRRAAASRDRKRCARAFTERNALLGDPDFEPVPLARLLSKEHAALLRAPDQPREAHADAGLRRRHSATAAAPRTTRWWMPTGNAVSTTTTLNNSYGSHVTVAGAGFLLNDEMDDFAAAPGTAEHVRPGAGRGQRDQAGQADALGDDAEHRASIRPGQLRLVVGTPGGPTIITQVYHVISNVIDHGMSLPDAVEAPRMHHQGLPDQMRLEGPGGFAPATIAWLKAMGHTVQNSGGMGDVQAIARIKGGWQGVSDPRLGGGPSGY